MKVSIKELLAGLENAQEIEQHIKQVMEEQGYKLFIDDGANNRYVPKSRLDAKIAELARLNESLQEVQGNYDELKANAQNNEEEATKVEELNKALTQYKERIEKMQLQSALNEIGKEFQARNVDDLLAFLDMAKVVIDEEGGVQGLKEQVEALRENKAYLFNVEEQQVEGIGTFLARTGAPGKPANVSSFGSKTTHSGDFGKQLASNVKEQAQQVDSNYFFKD